jgi:hypothetical protein
MYSVPIAYLLWFVSGFGCLGLHRLYLGKIPSGILWMCSAGLFGLGSIYDFFTLPRQVAEANLLRAARYGVTIHPTVISMPHPVEEHNRQRNAPEPLELVILRLARQRRGVVTPGEAALEAKVSLDEAKRELERLLKQGHAELRVRKSGVLVYTFPEFMNPEEGFEV